MVQWPLGMEVEAQMCGEMKMLEGEGMEGGAQIPRIAPPNTDVTLGLFCGVVHLVVFRAGSGSALWDHSWWSSGDPTECWGLNPS